MGNFHHHIYDLSTTIKQIVTRQAKLRVLISRNNATGIFEGFSLLEVDWQVVTQFVPILMT